MAGGDEIEPAGIGGLDERREFNEFIA